MSDNPPAAEAPEPLLSSIWSWLAVALLLAAMCYFSLGHYDHNDHMYAVAPVLGVHMRAYTDFPFVQTPLSLLLYEVVLRVVGEAHLYTSLRMLSLGLNLLIVLLGVLLCQRHAQRKSWASLTFVGLYVAFRPDDKIGAEIGNYTLALGLTAAALVWLDAFRGRSSTPWVVGVLAGLALSAKLSYVFGLPAFGLIFLLWQRSPRNLFARMGAYGLGALIGASPILFYLGRDFDRFLFENVHFHYLSNLYRQIPTVTWLSAVPLPLFSSGSGIVSLGLFGLLCLVCWALAILVLRLFPPLRALLLPLTPIERDTLCAGAAMVVGAVTPGVVFQQYMAGPAFAVFLFVTLYLDRLWSSERLGVQWRTRGPIGVGVAATLLGALQANALTHETLGKQHDGDYGIVAVAQARARLGRVIAMIDSAHPHCHGDLLTAVGVPAVGAGITFAPIDSAGSFAMRLDPIFQTEAPGWRWISDPSRYLTPRSLILSGFYVDQAREPNNPFESVMDGYAARHGFVSVPLGPYFQEPLVLYAPAACGVPAVGQNITPKQAAPP